jgi:branched-chain amino acid transport system permease protein
VSNAWFWALGGMLVAALWLAGRLVTNEYVFFVGYAVAQYILLATAWNLLGGYAGYINFGTAAFFALGAYVSVAINKLVELPLPVLILAGAVAAWPARPCLSTSPISIRRRLSTFPMP